MVIRSFEKTAAFGRVRKFLNTLKGAVTGKEYTYHGTSLKRARAIRSSGLKPDRHGGVSKHVSGSAFIGDQLSKRNKGLVFTTRNKDMAGWYGDQQAGIEEARRLMAYIRAGKLKRVFPKELHKTVSKFVGNRRLRPSLRVSYAKTRASIPLGLKSDVVEMVVPKGALKSVKNPELEAIKKDTKILMRRAKAQAKGQPGKRKLLEALFKLTDWARRQAFANDVVYKGGVPPKYIKKK